MDISFLIPALNEAHNIGRCVESIASSVPEGLRYEVIVGDHGSKDGTAGVARARGAKVIAHGRSTVGALRNALFAHSSGDVIVFIDADVTLTPEWRKAIPAVLADMRANPRQIAGSLCDPPVSDNFFLRYWFGRMKKKVTTYLGTGHLLITRSLFEGIKGFDANLVSGEDYDLCQRARSAGAAIRIEPQLRAIHHDYPLTAGEFLAREAWHGTGDFQTFAAFKASRVAQSAVVFSALHLGILAGLFVCPALAIASFGLLALGLAAGSVAKFPGLPATDRLRNVAIFYLYLLGRSASAWQALKRRWTSR